MTKNTRSNRLNKIINILKDCNGTSIKSLASKLNVSTMTIHRDLAILRTNNIVDIVHGAAIYNPDAIKADQNTEYHIVRDQIFYDNEKSSIGKTAAKLIMPNDIIILDGGTTTVNIARNLPINSQITVICYTLNVLNEVLKKGIDNIVFGGGYYHPNTQMFESTENLQMFKGIRANKMFVSAAGVNPTLGITCANKYEASTKQTCLSTSIEKILVVDSSKLGVVKPAFFCALGDIDVIVTDSLITEEWIQVIRDKNITLEIAP